jgi:hypothetical protein
MYSSYEHKMAFCASIDALPVELRQLIWENLVQLVDNDDKKPPDAPKKISRRTLNMMERWRMNGLWTEHRRQIQF